MAKRGRKKSAHFYIVQVWYKNGTHKNYQCRTESTFQKHSLAALNNSRAERVKLWEDGNLTLDTNSQQE